MPRNTSTGAVYEEAIRSYVLSQCKKYGMTAKTQVTVGEKPGGGKHRVDWELTSMSDENVRGLISCKIQTKSGTAEEKVAYEVIKLLFTLDQYPAYKKAWLVLGGDGWSNGAKQFITTELHKWVPELANGNLIIVTSTDTFFSTSLQLPNL
jgi:flavorubredoxin